MTPSSISSAKITIPTQTYTGKTISLDPKDIKVMVGKEELKPYEPATQPNGYVIVGYTNNINKGTAKVTIRGMGNYGGFKTQSFKIKAKGFRWWWRSSRQSYRYMFNTKGQKHVKRVLHIKSKTL